MTLNIDGFEICAEPGNSLLDLIRSLGADRTDLRDRPLAAKIAGEVFNLNDIPVRSEQNGDDSPIRRAIEVSGGVVHLIRYNDLNGRDLYKRSFQFVLFMVLDQLWPEAIVKMTVSSGGASFAEVSNVKDFCAARLKKLVSDMIAKDIMLVCSRMTTDNAIRYYVKKKEYDKVRLLALSREPYLGIYAYEGFMDYNYGELVPSTGYLRIWDLQLVKGGFMVLYPDDNNPDRVASYNAQPDLISACAKGFQLRDWMKCETIADLNDLTKSGKIRELIRVNEAFHEKSYSQIADQMCSRQAQTVFLAGPSSSGKTTSAHRIATQLRTHGKNPVLISLDDYYIDRDLLVPNENGQFDFEHINTIDVQLFQEQLRSLLNGEAVRIPQFDFITGKRNWRDTVLKITEKTVIIVEGLHALNPVLTPAAISANLVFKVYVSPLQSLNLDNHNRISAGLLRLLRRVVRDQKTRGSSVQKTLSMWDSVRRGEKRWIFPYQEQADMIFDSATLYELAVLKKHVYPLLQTVDPEDPHYEQVCNAVKILNYVLEADVDDEIPPTSLIREFIGGNSYYK